jgi:hypothetical protein
MPSTLLVLLDTLPLELNGIAISHHRPLITVMKVFLNVKLWKHPNLWPAEPFTAGLDAWNLGQGNSNLGRGKKVIRFTASGIRSIEANVRNTMGTPNKILKASLNFDIL